MWCFPVLAVLFLLMIVSVAFRPFWRPMFGFGWRRPWFGPGWGWRRPWGMGMRPGPYAYRRRWRGRRW